MSLTVYSFLNLGKDLEHSKYSINVYGTELNWLGSGEGTLNQSKKTLIINQNANSLIYAVEYVHFIDS